MKKSFVNVAKAAFLALTLGLAATNVSPAQAAGTGSVSGTAKVSVDGAPAVGLNAVKVHLATYAYMLYGTGTPVETTTASDGSYSFSEVADGTYYTFIGDYATSVGSSASKLLTDANGTWYPSIEYIRSAGYGTAYYAQVVVAGGNAAIATDIVLNGFGSVGTISGSVLDGNGQPIAPIPGYFGGNIDTSSVKEGVYVLDSGGYVLFYQYADLTGHFSFNMPAGTYSLSFGDPESADFGGDFIFEDGTNDIDFAPTFDVVKDGVSANHNFVIRSFDTAALGVNTAKIVGQIKSGTSLKLTGLTIPAGATANIYWSCADSHNTYSTISASGSTVAISQQRVGWCASGKVRAEVDLSKPGYLQASINIDRTLKVVSSANAKYTASSSKLVNKFPNIVGTSGVGNVLHGDPASFKLKKVSLTQNTWYRCPTIKAAQTTRLVGCEVAAANSKTYRVTQYDTGSYLVYRVQVKKYTDSRTRGTVAPADSTPFFAGYIQ